MKIQCSFTVSGHDNSGLILSSAGPDADSNANDDTADAANDDGNNDADGSGSRVVNCTVVVFQCIIKIGIRFGTRFIIIWQRFVQLRVRRVYLRVRLVYLRVRFV